MDYLGTAAIIGCYLAIIGLYVWVFKTVQEVKDIVSDNHVWTIKTIQDGKDKMAEHLQEGGCHVDSSKLVFKEVCDEKVRRIETLVADVRLQVLDVKSTLSDGISELKGMIKH